MIYKYCFLYVLHTYIHAYIQFLPLTCSCHLKFHLKNRWQKVKLAIFLFKKCFDHVNSIAESCDYPGGTLCIQMMETDHDYGMFCSYEGDSNKSDSICNIMHHPFFHLTYSSGCSENNCKAGWDCENGMYIKTKTLPRYLHAAFI